MDLSETVDLVVGGARLCVLRDPGLALLERHRILLAEGRTEAVEIPLQEHPLAVLHLLLGAEQLAVIEYSRSPELAGDADAGRADGSDRFEAAEVFLDFDAYL